MAIGEEEKTLINITIPIIILFLPSFDGLFFVFLFYFFFGVGVIFASALGICFIFFYCSNKNCDKKECDIRNDVFISMRMLMVEMLWI